jgi:hypothetical protein
MWEIQDKLMSKSVQEEHVANIRRGHEVETFGALLKNDTKKNQNSG